MEPTTSALLSSAFTVQGKAVLSLVGTTFGDAIMKRLTLLLSLGLLVVGLARTAFAQVGIVVVPRTSSTPLVDGANDEDRKIGCDKWCVQSWWLNDLSRQRQVMTGTLIARAKNDDHVYDDYDFNLCLLPDADFSYLSWNVQNGKRTPSRTICGGAQVPRGAIEAELRSALSWTWMKNSFPTGKTVTAYGWWPHDNGHPEEDDPSELHPLIWIATQGIVSSAYIAAGQDLSSRFFVSAWPIEESIDAVYQPAGRTTVHPGGLPQTVPVNVLRESAQALRMGAEVRA